MPRHKFHHMLLLGMVTSLTFGLVYTYLVKEELVNEFIGTKFVIDSEVDFEATALFTYSDKFKGANELGNASANLDTLVFLFPKADSTVKKFRLDLGNNTKMRNLKIEQMHLLFKEKTIVFERNEVFDSFYNISPSIELDKKNHIIYLKRASVPFDPYIIFSPLGELVLKKSFYDLVLVLPFLVFLVIHLIYKRKAHKIGILELLVLLFIFCIPLKIAWTTFCTILIAAFGLVLLLRNKQTIALTPAALIFLSTFLVYILFGRPSSLASIDLQLSYLIFSFIASTVALPKTKVYTYYTFFFLILNGIMLVSGIVFLLWFKEFYGLDLIDYYEDIKIYSGDIRDWLHYDHPAFLSFFGLTGLLFLHRLYDKKKVQRSLLALYHVLLLAFILLSATRICLLIYIIFVINLFLKWDGKKMIWANLTLFVIMSLSLNLNIQKVDENRNLLWKISWEAIKEKPFFGYGVDHSKEIFTNEVFIEKDQISNSFDFNHSHNQFLTLIIELGFIGFLTLTGSGLYFFIKMRLYKDPDLVLFVFGIAYIFQTESILQTSKPLYVICFLFLALTADKIIDKKQNLI